MRQFFEQLDGKTKPVYVGQGKATRLLLASEDRARCECCSKRKHTTVNGVCLDCQRSNKQRFH